MSLSRWSLMLSLLWSLCIPRAAHACACGCGVFEVGTSAMFPTHEGGMAFLEYDYLNQGRNWRGDSPASADENEDKRLVSNFFTAGAQYQFNRRWGVMGEIPVTYRRFKTSETDSGDVETFDHTAVGDIRIKGMYTGLSDDLSSGLTFGLRLPTGSATHPHFDPDVQIGSGSTDLLLGGYHLMPLTTDQHWDAFMSAEADVPVLHEAGYTPGTEINAAGGVYYNHWWIGPVKIAPLAQVIGSRRWSDAGSHADAPNTGYDRVLVAPGIEFDMAHVRVYTDVGFPVYQHTTGDQVVASQYFKFNVSVPF